MTTIKDANLNLPVEFWGHQNDVRQSMKTLSM